MEYPPKKEKIAREKEIDVELLKKKRRHLSKRSMLKKKSKFLLYIVLAFSLLYILFYSPLFEIKNIDIGNLNYLDESSIQAELDYLVGQNFFLSDLPVARSKMVEKYVFVEEIRTEKVFPDTVIVDITEREPFLLANNAITGCYLLDRDGYILSPRDSSCVGLEESYEVIEIIGGDIDNFEFLHGAKSQFYLAIKLYEVTNVLQYYAYSVESMNLENQVLKIETTGERTIIFSVSDDLEFQLKRLIILTQQARHHDLDFEVMDLRFERPILVEKG